MATNEATAVAGTLAPVGLFGLQRKNIPAPAALAAMPSRSRRPSAVTGTACTGAPIAAAARPGASNVGDATTSDRDDDVKAIVAARSSSPEPGVR